jgi:C-terminal processing protease CtpA/Prc
VSEIVPKSPAEESREVRVGDILLSVDGQQVQGMHLDSVNRLIAGSVGSSVNLEFQHEDGSTSRISFTRREIYRS